MRSSCGRIECLSLSRLSGARYAVTRILGPGWGSDGFLFLGGALLVQKWKTDERRRHKRPQSAVTQALEGVRC
jgi:hypothetical protein